MSFITIKPADGLRVIMPPALGASRGIALPEAGKRVELTPFVQRRLDCGDVVKIDDVKIDEKEDPAPPPADRLWPASEPAVAAAPAAAGAPAKPATAKPAPAAPGPVEETR